LSRDGVAAADESPVAFLSEIGGGTLIGQIVLTGTPVLLALRSAPAAEVTALFATLALFRAPYTLSLGIVAQITGRLTAAVAARREDMLRRIRLGLLVGSCVTATVGAAVAAVIGPALVRAVFGSEVRVSAAAAAGVAVGTAFAIANLATTLVLIARGLSSAVLRSWLVAVAAGAACIAIPSLGLLTDTIVVFVVAEAAAFVLMMIRETAGANAAVTRLSAAAGVIEGEQLP
jgi:O-antigen/teichoic acid export membrane protein